MPARAALVAALLLGTLLRLYPIHAERPAPELEQHFPRLAVMALARGDWQPTDVVHGSLLTHVLRATYTLGYAGGRLLGRYEDRVDPLASFIRDPWPFVLTGRVVVLLCSLGSLLLVGLLGTRLFGPPAGAAATLFLAVTFVHLRESHHVYVDVPAGFGALVAAALGVRALARPGATALLGVGAAAGVTLASNYRALPVLLIPLAVACLAGPARPGALLSRAVVSAAGAVLAFGLLSLFVLAEPAAVWNQLRLLAGVGVGGEAAVGLSLAELLHLVVGPALLLLALLGAVAAAWRAPAATLVCALYPLGSLLTLLLASFLFTRYLASLAPFVALFAGHGLVLAARGIRPGGPEPVALLLALAVATPSFLQCLAYDRLLARDNTLSLSGRWLVENVAPGTTITLPDRVPHLNPVVPPDAVAVKGAYRDFAETLMERGVGAPASAHRLHYLGFFGNRPEDWKPAPGIVVTSRHPELLPALSTPPEYLERLRAVGAEELARFDGVADPLPEGTIYDPRCGEFLPLRGFGAVARPGPNVVVWRVPAQPAAAPGP